MKPHKHAEVIKAWADGHIVQFKDNNGDWVDSTEEDEIPLFFESSECRIKPEPTVRFLGIDDCATFDDNFHYNLEMLGTWKNKLKLIFDEDGKVLLSAEVIS